MAMMQMAKLERVIRTEGSNTRRVKFTMTAIFVGLSYITEETQTPILELNFDFDLFITKGVEGTTTATLQINTEHLVAVLVDSAWVGTVNSTNRCRVIASTKRQLAVAGTNGSWACTKHHALPRTQLLAE